MAVVLGENTAVSVVFPLKASVYSAEVDTTTLPLRQHTNVALPNGVAWTVASVSLWLTMVAVPRVESLLTTESEAFTLCAASTCSTKSKIWP